MKKKYLWSVLALTVLSLNIHAQDNLWKTATAKDISKLKKLERKSFPQEHLLYKLDIEKLKNTIKAAPSDGDTTKSTVIVNFPNSNGVAERFEIYKAAVMEEGLSAKFPEIQSYSGKSLDNPTSSIRFSITAFGLHSINYSAESGITYTDSYTTDLQTYIVYNRASLLESNKIKCLVENQDEQFADSLEEIPLVQRATSDTFREYRLAMASTIEYSKFHIDAARLAGIPVSTDVQKKAAVLSAMVATMTRVNFIFERDMGLRMKLVANNDKIIFITTDNFTNNNAEALLSESQTVITKEIKSINFDIGHTVSTGGGGLARLTAPCNNDIKAMGITGSASPVGDPYDIDFVAHEMGHQFGAKHTYNNSCVQNQISLDTSMEVGSGTTIMGYAGVCDVPATNVELHSDPFFHNISIRQMSAFVTARGNCSANTPRNNPAPVINIGENRIIPKGTPFKLTASATDANNNNSLTYSWEQMDAEITVQPPVSTAVEGPLFRFYPPTTSPTRYFPKFEDVLVGINRKWEVLPTVSRVLNFNLLVRDNNTTLGGQTSVASTKVVVANAGPFEITYPHTINQEFVSGSTQNITWQVAGTTANGINTSHVNILLSTDNGISFIPIAENTANDGEEEVTIPGFTSDQCRILIEPTNNIYYAVSKKFKITGGTASTEEFDLKNFQLYPNPTNGNFTIEFNSSGNNPIQISIHDLNGRLLLDQKYQNIQNFREEIEFTKIQSGIYIVTIQDGSNKAIKKLIKK